MVTPRADGDREALDDFAGVVADHVDAEHPVGLLVDDQLHERPDVPVREGVAHGAELGAVGVEPGAPVPTRAPR